MFWLDQVQAHLQTGGTIAYLDMEGRNDEIVNRIKSRLGVKYEFHTHKATPQSKFK